jgi:hypothetical protein
VTRKEGEMAKYRKKPVVIEAMQFTGSNQVEAAAWMGCSFPERTSEYAVLEINTLEGTMRVSPGDWIIKGVKGEFYPCKPDIFEATYEAVPAGGVHHHDSVDDFVEALVDRIKTPSQKAILDAKGGGDG